jgi:hypothetical protein
MGGADSLVSLDKGIKLGLDVNLGMPKLVGPDIDVGNCGEDELRAPLVDKLGKGPLNKTPGTEEVKERGPDIGSVVIFFVKVEVKFKDGEASEICIKIGKTADPVL